MADDKPVWVDFLAGPDIHELNLSDHEILAAIEGQLAAQGRGETVIGERTHLMPKAGVPGHFNVLRGWIGADVHRAGVKVVSDFVDNYKHGMPSEYGVLVLMDEKVGAPTAILDATHLTDMRTGAMTAIGAKFLARKNSKVLGHIGARGSSYWNVRLLDSLFNFDEIRVHSRRPDSYVPFAEQLSRDLGKSVRAVESWEEAIVGADIVVEASRLTAPEPLLKTAWIKEGALVMPYGTMSALELSLTDIMSKLVVDDWGQVHAGPLGALRAHVNAGKLTRETLHAEMGQIVAGLKPGRENDSERILYWHRGLSLSDIALGHAMLAKAKALGVGQRLRFH
jgi:ornithine cyclodeaminase